MSQGPHQSTFIFVAFVEDNVTMSSVSYFENRVSYFCAKPKKVDPINVNFCITKCFNALKYIINNGILK